MLRSSVLCCACLLGSNLAWSADDYRFSGPYTHDNLSIYLIHGARRVGKSFLTLQEALDQKKVVVYETGNVNELAIENLSSDDVYVQSGDIVKGGRQDRVFPDDFLLPSKSGKVPISSFCVEQGRWTRRGAERADRFSASTDAVASKSLKLAARKKQEQASVWREVAVAQARLADSTGLASVSSPSSSMQLALENQHVKDASDAYIRKLSSITDGRHDVVGYAFAINGKLNSADVYASHDLFQRMWPKLLKASSIEALAERQKGKATSPPGPESLRAAFADAEHGRESSKDVANRLKLVTKETDKAVMFETRDATQQGEWIHKSYVVKIK